MKDLVNEGRHLQDNFKEKIVKEDPMISPTTTGSSKLDAHYKINHPVLTLINIDRDNTGFTSLRASKTSMTMTFAFKSQVDNIEPLKMDARKIAKNICEMLDNYNTDHRPGTPLAVYNQDIKQNVIVVPITVSHWTGD